MKESNNYMYAITDLNQINEELKPLKKLADKELISIAGLSGMIYTPHIDAYHEVCVKKAVILRSLKKNNVIACSEIETISAQLEVLHKKIKNGETVEYEKCKYQRRFTPLKLSKSGKIVQKWAKFWLKLDADDNVNQAWQMQVKEIWPEYFLIRAIDI
ncbi:hypothetical protein [Thalassotalea sp. ND16A]|uniref:hypothetical protein n=1 Tax=Thalassotalea sp. ND16A TaxID=1535422 RepID=UPI00051A0A4A|nr:hypothetical protein [Thalassotalea sp. ND16A]KGJ89430.1 hypothetical protein ND16A_2323 [Thalassotalea sp. ND16A]